MVILKMKALTIRASWQRKGLDRGMQSWVTTLSLIAIDGPERREGAVCLPATSCNLWYVTA